jgi:hypothetical protein
MRLLRSRFATVSRRPETPKLEQLGGFEHGLVRAFREDTRMVPAEA